MCLAGAQSQNSFGEKTSCSFPAPLEKLWGPCPWKGNNSHGIRSPLPAPGWIFLVPRVFLDPRAWHRDSLPQSQPRILRDPAEGEEGGKSGIKPWNDAAPPLLGILGAFSTPGKLRHEWNSRSMGSAREVEGSGSRSGNGGKNMDSVAKILEYQ